MMAFYQVFVMNDERSRKFRFAAATPCCATTDSAVVLLHQTRDRDESNAFALFANLMPCPYRPMSMPMPMRMLMRTPIP